MTFPKYLVCRLAVGFGYTRKNTRLGDAASEMHLLKEAEAHLGEAIWKNVEEIEELSAEYWNLRKLITEHKRVTLAISKLRERLDSSHNERTSLLGNSNVQYQDFLVERSNKFAELEILSRERDAVIANARDVRRNYDGLKTKQEVIAKEGGKLGDIEKVEKRLAELKNTFTDLKKQRQEVATKIIEKGKAIESIETKINAEKMDGRTKASAVFQDIGGVNQELSTFRAELGMLETQMRQRYSEIGRFVSRNADKSLECRKAALKQRGLVDVMAALRRSVQFNHELANLS